MGGVTGVLEAAAVEGSGFTSEPLALFPPAGGPDSPTGFGTLSLLSVCVFLGIQWWANDQVDGGSLAVQRISACKSLAAYLEAVKSKCLPKYSSKGSPRETYQQEYRQNCPVKVQQRIHAHPSENTK